MNKFDNSEKLKLQLLHNFNLCKNYSSLLIIGVFDTQKVKRNQFFFNQLISKVQKLLYYYY